MVDYLAIGKISQLQIFSSSAHQLVHPDLKEVIESCLQVLPEDRPSAEQLQTYRLFTANSFPTIFKFPTAQLAPDLLRTYHLVSQRPLKEVCHFWHLVGGDVEAEVRKASILRNKPAIFSLPWYIYVHFSPVFLSLIFSKIDL